MTRKAKSKSVDGSAVKTLTSTLRLELVKPVDRDWSELSLLLFALRTPIRNVLNATVTDLELAFRAGNQTHPRTLSYQRVSHFWTRAREDSSESKNAQFARLNDKIRLTEIGSMVTLGVAEEAYARWGKYHKERTKGTMSLPCYAGKQPICVAGKGVSLAAEDGGYVLDVAFLAGRYNSTRLAVRPYGPSGYAMLHRLISGEVRLGSIKIVRERHNGKAKWQILIACTFERPLPPAELNIMAVHRGIHCFLTCSISGSEKHAYTTVLETGLDVLAHQQAYSARRRGLGAHGRELGRGAKGHGTERRYERITRLEDSDARWTRTKCQEVAAHAIKLAKRRHVGTILLEKWNNPQTDKDELAEKAGEQSFVERMVRHFPFAMLKECISFAAAKAGITVIEVGAEYDSRTCPACERLHAEVPIDKERTFMCEGCRLERNVDAIAAWNMLRKFGAQPPIKKAIKDSNKLAKKLGKVTVMVNVPPDGHEREGSGDDKLSGTAREDGSST